MLSIQILAPQKERSRVSLGPRSFHPCAKVVWEEKPEQTVGLLDSIPGLVNPAAPSCLPVAGGDVTSKETKGPSSPVSHLECSHEGTQRLKAAKSCGTILAGRTNVDRP